jgi:hypothetical protein
VFLVYVCQLVFTTGAEEESSSGYLGIFARTVYPSRLVRVEGKCAESVSVVVA